MAPSARKKKQKLNHRFRKDYDNGFFVLTSLSHILLPGPIVNKRKNDLSMIFPWFKLFCNKKGMGLIFNLKQTREAL